MCECAYCKGCKSRGVDANPKFISEYVVEHIEEHDCWSATDELAKITLAFLKKFKGMKRFGHPCIEAIESLEKGGKVDFFTFEPTYDNGAKWEEILDQMIEGFGILVNVYDFDRTEEQKKSIENAFTLYAKWFQHLWD